MPSTSPNTTSPSTTSPNTPPETSHDTPSSGTDSTQQPAEATAPIVTIYDVAKIAGVSYATVSRYLNGHPNVSKASAAKIDAAIAKTGFAPNSSARSLAKRRTHIVALIIHYNSKDVHNDPNIMSFLGGANTRVAEEGWQLVTLLASNDDASSNIEQLVASGLADGYILFTFDFNDALLPIFDKRHLAAAISATGYDRKSICPCVDVDNFGAMAEMIRYVLRDDNPPADRRRTRPAYISGPLDMPGAPERFTAFNRVIAERFGTEFEAPVAYSPKWSRDGGAQAIRQWASDGTLNRIDCIIAASDTIAAGAIDELHRLGRRVPDDIAVSGFDNSTAATACTPQITTVDQHIERRGAVMADIVIRQINGEHVPDLTMMPTELIARQSA